MVRSVSRAAASTAPWRRFLLLSLAAAMFAALVPRAAHADDGEPVGSAGNIAFAQSRSGNSLAPSTENSTTNNTTNNITTTNNTTNATSNHTENSTLSETWAAPEPILGQVLFELFRGDDLAALTALMVAESRASQPAYQAVRTANAQALLGRLQLQFGLPQTAEQTLLAALGRQLPDAVRDRVMLALAGSRAQRGDIGAALETLDGISAGDAAIRAEADLLRGRLLLQKRQHADADAALQRIAADSPVHAYALFNRALIARLSGEARQAREHLQQLVALPVSSPAGAGLRDRALLALAQSWMEAERPDEARAALLGVQLDGVYSQQALLTLGWAHARAGLYDKALAMWDTLAQRPLPERAVWEAKLARAWALQQLRAWPQALQAYREAEQFFVAERAALDQQRHQLISAHWLHDLLASPELIAAADAALTSGSGVADSAFAPVSLLAAETAPAFTGVALQRRLPLLLASTAFHQGYADWQSLHHYRRQLALWQQRLPVYQQMRDLHEQRFVARLPEVDAKLAKVDARSLSDQLQGAHQQLATAKAGSTPGSTEATSDDWTLLLSADETRSWQRLQRAEQKLAALQAVRGPMPMQAERLRLLRGQLQFSVLHDAADRLWRWQRQLQHTDRELKRAQLHRGALLSARDAAARRFNTFDARIEAVARRLETVSRRIDDMLGQQQQALTALANTQLDGHARVLQNLQEEAALAIARLQDAQLREQVPTVTDTGVSP